MRTVTLSIVKRLTVFYDPLASVAIILPFVVLLIALLKGRFITSLLVSLVIIPVLGT
jgi:hypothetical protein